MLRLKKEARLAGRRPATAAKRRPVDPDQPPFSSFLQRDQEREKRDRGRRRTLILSLAVHILALGALLAYSFMNVDELFGPSVEVKIFSPAKLPDGVQRPVPVRTMPLPAPRPAPTPDPPAAR